MNIRPIRESDSDEFLLLSQALDHETHFMMYEPGERTTTPEQQKQRLHGLLSQEGSMIFVAEQDDHLVGFLGAFGGDFRRNRHSAYIVAGVRQAFAGQGVGKQLFAALDEWARANHLHRLELTVMRHNERALNLYLKMGFQIEGIKKDSLLVDGKYVDEYYMGKILDI